MPALAVAAVATAASTAVKANAANKAAKAQQKALDNVQGVDIADAIQAARAQAENNVKASNELEAKYDPQTAALRTQANDQLSSQLSGDTNSINLRNSILSKLLGSAEAVSNPEDISLIRESNQAILDDLRLGGSIDPETQSAVVRAALQTSGNAGTLGSAASRGLVARDIGLTSLQLEQQRQDRALNAGNSLYSNKIAGANLMGNVGNLASTAVAQDLQRVGTISQLIDAREKPTAGLDPSSVVDLMIRNNDTQNSKYVQSGNISANKAASVGNALGSGIGQLGSLFAGGIAGASGGGFTAATGAADVSKVSPANLLNSTSLYSSTPLFSGR